MDSRRNDINEIKDMLKKLNSIKYTYKLEDIDSRLIIYRFNCYYQKWDILHEVNYGISENIDKEIEYIKNFIKNILTVEK